MEAVELETPPSKSVCNQDENMDVDDAVSGKESSGNRGTYGCEKTQENGMEVVNGEEEVEVDYGMPKIHLVTSLEIDETESEMSNDSTNPSSATNPLFMESEEGVSNSGEGEIISDESVSNSGERVINSEGVPNSEDGVSNSGEGVINSEDGVSNSGEGGINSEDSMSNSGEGAISSKESVPNSEDKVPHPEEGLPDTENDVPKSKETSGESCTVEKSFTSEQTTETDTDVVESTSTEVNGSPESTEHQKSVDVESNDVSSKATTDNGSIERQENEFTPPGTLVVRSISLVNSLDVVGTSTNGVPCAVVEEESESELNRSIESDREEEVITGDKTISADSLKKDPNVVVVEEHLDSLLTDPDSGDVQANGPSTEESSKSVEPETLTEKDCNSGSTRSVRTLKVIYPKKKYSEINQVHINVIAQPMLTMCLQCSKMLPCKIRITVGGSVCYLCSEECLNVHKKIQRDTLKRVQVSGGVKDWNEASKQRFCAFCNALLVNQPQDKILSWETMEFCAEDCLSKYQSKMGSRCIACNGDVPMSSMGKYCVRFGHEVKQFCNATCLEDFKKGLKVCSYCQKDISSGADGFLAPIGDKGQFKDFCSQMCLDEYDCMSRNVPVQLKVKECDVCAKIQLVQIQVISGQNTVNLCSEVCFAAFKFVNTISSTPCFMCKKYYDSSSGDAVTVYYENELLTFCSKSCMNINILAKRKIVACSWCKVKKYNFDMVRRKLGNGIVHNWCSLNCMALFQVSVNAVSLRSKVYCTQCKKFDLPIFHLTMSDATVRNFCCLECVNQFQAIYKQKSKELGGPFPTGTPKKVLRAVLPGESEASSPDMVPGQGVQPLSVVQAVTSLKKSTSGAEQLKVISTPVSQVSPTPPQPSHSPATTAPSLVTSGTTHIKCLTLVMPSPKPSIRNAKIQTHPATYNKAVSAKPSRSTKYVQTEAEEKREEEESEEDREKSRVLIPIPVPIFVPAPMAMYSMPTPVALPFPVPIPVPVFIPTTHQTAEQIFADIKRIQEKMPGNPFEAELLMMAEMVAGGGKTTPSDKTGDTAGSTDSTEQGREERRPGCQESSGSGNFNEDVLEMALSMATVMDPAVTSPPLHNNTTTPHDDEEDERGIGQKRTRDEEDSSVSENPPKKRKDDILDSAARQMTTSRLSISLKETLGVSAWKHHAVRCGERTDLLEMRPGELAQSLRRFVKEAVLPGGAEFTPDQKYYILLGIQCYLKENGRIDNIFADPIFEPFVDALDEEARKFISMFSSCDNVITRVEEEHLWESNQLGPDAPHTLLSTLIYFNTKYFNLTTVEEHMQLSFSHIMKHWKRNPNSTGGGPTAANSNNKGSNSWSRNVLLRFYPPQSAVDAPNSKKKVVYEQQANEDDPYRCPVHLYEFYLSKCPESVKSRSDMFYLSPERSCVADSPIWYSTLPLDQDHLEKILNRFRMVKEINLALLSS